MKRELYWFCTFAAKTGKSLLSVITTGFFGILRGNCFSNSPVRLLVTLYQGIEDKFADKFLEEDGSLKTGGMAEKATAAYHKVEDTVVGGYKKVENAFVDAFLEKVDEPESKDSEGKK